MDNTATTPKQRGSFGKLFFLIPLFCLLNYWLFNVYWNKIFFRAPNQVEGPLGAPFAGFFLLAFYLLFLSIGAYGISVGFKIKRLGWILFVLASIYTVGTFVYPILLFQISSSENYVLGYYKYPASKFVGTWEDDYFHLKLSEDYSYQFMDKIDGSLINEGRWNVTYERVRLLTEDETSTSFLVITKNDTLFLSYTYEEYYIDPDSWDGYLGLMKTSDSNL